MVKFLKPNFLFLAPMAGFSNSACREICREYGADGVVSEFVYSRAVLSQAEKIMQKIAFAESERPVGIQIFGSDPCEVAESAVLIEEKLSPDFIDINFGCPAPNATHAGAGSALLKTPDKMCAIVKKVSESLKKTPLTAKMRTGWDSSSIVVPDVAKALVDNGVEMITLHGRTKAQGYEGDADWSLIEKTAESVDVAVIGNGSVEKLTSQQLRSSACAGFMIGRAALGNPWIFSKVRAKLEGTDEPNEPTPQERVRLALRYAEIMTSGKYLGIDVGNLTHAKVQIMRFLKNAPRFKKLRVGLKDVNTLDELKELLCEYI